ncbi:unnamed protein product [Oncorhynchus mykiss]|uniref:Cyclin N-terminal domain-containing protein n=1 Tax=Oncorhynchus mykiss TaxID=8022 RepID=A0A060W167_ONCMY|nr:unnamed protein product [Oncorhynchus mykiss]
MWTVDITVTACDVCHHAAPVRRKYSSCSTIFLDDSTVSQPNLKYTIKCVALAIYYHIKNREIDGRMVLDIFDEKLHPLTKSEIPADYEKHDPEQKQIYRFVRTLFSAAQLTAECAIVTLVSDIVITPCHTTLGGIQKQCLETCTINKRLNLAIKIPRVTLLGRENVAFVKSSYTNVSPCVLYHLL